MSSPINVTIADDHQGIIDGYLYRFSGVSDLNVVGIAYNGEQLEEILERCPTDVLILDLDLPIAPRCEEPYPILRAIPALLKGYPSLAILMISMHNERTLIQSCIKGGAKGYILKDDREAIEDLVRVVRLVAKGGFYFSAQAFSQWQKSKSASESVPTTRQLEVLSLCAAYPNLTTVELAKQLGVAPTTIRNLLSMAYRRLGVANRTAAIAKARQLRLITPYVTYKGQKEGNEE